MIEVVAGIIRSGNNILIARRKPGQALEGKWEFPGGKIEEGETPEECLQRELFEEFAIETAIGGFFAENTHAYGQYIIHLSLYEVRHISGDLTPSVHDEIAWVSCDELTNYDLAPADLPFVEKLQADVCRRAEG